MRGSSYLREHNQQVLEIDKGYELHRQVLQQIKKRNQPTVPDSINSSLRDTPSTVNARQFMPYSRPLVYSTTYSKQAMRLEAETANTNITTENVPKTSMTSNDNPSMQSRSPGSQEDLVGITLPQTGLDSKKNDDRDGPSEKQPEQESLFKRRSKTPADGAKRFFNLRSNRPGARNLALRQSLDPSQKKD